MTKSKKQANVTTYTVKKNYRVDIFAYKDEYEAWLYDNNIGHKSHMFSVPIKQHNADGTLYTVSYEDFVRMVENNVDEYIQDLLKDIKVLEKAVELEYYR